MGAVTIFRIVNKSRRGMYHSFDDGISLWGETHGGGNAMKHPLPCSDGIHGLCVDHRFGFYTIDQLKKWTETPEIRHAMTELGGKINVYRVPERHVIFGGRQVAFLLNRSRKINEYPVNAVDLGVLL